MPTLQTTRPTGRPPGWPWYPVIYGLLCWVAALLSNGLPAWTAAAVGTGVALVGIGIVRSQWPAQWFSRGFTDSACLFAVVVGAATAAWLWLAGGQPLLVWRWLLLGDVLAGGWFAVLVWRAPAWAAAVAASDGPAAVPVEEQQLGGIYHGILSRAGVLPGCRITKVETSPSGGVEIVHLASTRRAGGRAFTFSQLVGKHAAIATEADLAFIEQRSTGIDDDQITPVRVSSARFQLLFTVKETFAGEIPYPIRTEPRDMSDPSVLGHYETDDKIEITLSNREYGAEHMDVLAGKGGGKSTICNVVAAEDFACDHWEVWVITRQKLVPLVWPWLEPWLRGETDRPIFDRICGESQEQVLEGLADAVVLMTEWNRHIGTDGVRQPAPGDSGLTLILDEASSSLTDRETITFECGGTTYTMNASQLVAKLAELSRSAQLKIVRASQYGLFHKMGPAGSDSMRNFLCAIVGRVARQGDATAVASGMPKAFNATRLRNNMIYVQPNLEDPVVLRAKAFALFKQHIRPVVLAYTKWRTGLAPKATALLGAGYVNRWAAANHPELVAYAREQGLQWRSWPPVPTTTEATSETSAAPVDPVVPAPVVPAPATPVAVDEPPATTDDGQRTTSADQEVPVADELAVPDGWADPHFDVMAALAGEPQPERSADDGPGPSSVLAARDTSGIKAALARMAEQDEHVRMLTRLPEPLGQVLAHMLHPKAQPIVSTGWVPTEVLAISLGRCAADGDEDTRRRAAEQLGRELTATDPTGQLNSVQRRMGGGVRMRGFLVADLRELGVRLGGTDGTDPRHGTGGTVT